MKKKRKYKFFVKHPLLTKVMRYLLVFILICFTLYIILGILLFFNTDRFVYHPTKDDFYSCDKLKEFTKEEYNGTRFYYRDAVDDQTVMVYYHGNGGSACDRHYLTGGFNRIGVRIIFVEYSGYANDTQSPSKELLLQDVHNVNNFIKSKNIPNIAVVGESLGSAMASYHSSIEKNVYSVILVAGFDSIQNIAESRYLKYYPLNLYDYDNYDNIQYLQNYTKRLVMIHGSLDENIPIIHAKRLYESTPASEKAFIEHQNAKHNELYRYFDTYRAIRAGVNEENLNQFILLN